MKMEWNYPEIWNVAIYYLNGHSVYAERKPNSLEKTKALNWAVTPTPSATKRSNSTAMKATE